MIIAEYKEELVQKALVFHIFLENNYQHPYNHQYFRNSNITRRIQKSLDDPKTTQAGKKLGSKPYIRLDILFFEYRDNPRNHKYHHYNEQEATRSSHSWFIWHVGAAVDPIHS